MTGQAALRDLVVAGPVTRLLPETLLWRLLTGPRPDSYTCPACRQPADLDGPAPTSVGLRRHPAARCRRVVLAHAGCVPSTVSLADPTDPIPELPDLAYTDLLHPGIFGRPLLVLDSDELRTTDPTGGGAPQPGRLLDPFVPAALAHGLTCLTDLTEDLHDAPGWTVHVPGPGLLRVETPLGTADVAHHADPGWLDAAARQGSTALYVARIGLSRHHPERPNRPGPVRPAATRPAPTQFRLHEAAREGRAAAARVAVRLPGATGRPEPNRPGQATPSAAGRSR